MAAKRYQVGEKKRMQVYSKTNGKCFYCGVGLEIEDILDWGGKVVTQRHHWNVDHMLPVSRGGEYNLENLVPACVSCNGFKGTRTAEEFIQQEQDYLQRRAR